MVLSDNGLLSRGKSSIMYDSPNLEETSLALSLPDLIYRRMVTIETPKASAASLNV